MKFGAALGLCVVLMTNFATDRGLPAVIQARQHAQRLATDIAALRAENARLRARAEALRSDPAAIEQLARETLGLARRGEIVIVRPHRRLSE